MSGAPSSYTIDSPDATVNGKSISQWTQDWWTWAVQSPAYHNALDDQTGQYAHVNNGSSVFFIGGTLGGDAIRTFTVPAGKPLLVPVLNTFDTLDPANAETDYVNQWPGTVTNLSASIDGTPIQNLQNYLETSQPFSMGTVRPNTVITEMFGNAVYKGEELTPTQATGYYLMIEGLSAGQHTLEFTGSTTDGFSTHVVDHITVAPGNQV